VGKTASAIQQACPRGCELWRHPLAYLVEGEYAPRRLARAGVIAKGGSHTLIHLVPETGIQEASGIPVAVARAIKRSLHKRRRGTLALARRWAEGTVDFRVVANHHCWLS
jgi:hypothetical protein